jgi:hypothetical protein
MDSKYKLNIDDDKSLEDINQFQRLVGKLIYLNVTRSDASYSISQISKFMYLPRASHLNVIDRILRYLNSTLRLRIYFKNNNNNEIYSYFDLNWAGDFDQKCTTYFCTFVCRNIIT